MWIRIRGMCPSGSFSKTAGNIGNQDELHNTQKVHEYLKWSQQNCAPPSPVFPLSSIRVHYFKN